MSDLIDSVLENTTNNVAAPVRGVTVDEAGRKRSQEDFDAAVKAGFAPREALYRRGTMVVQDGVNNFRNSRQSWEKLPRIGEACRDFERKISDEKRRDVLVRAATTRMGATGRLLIKPLVDGVERETVSVALTPNAFKDLCSRVGFGGGAYLADKCWPELRAMNVNHQLAARGRKEDEALKLASSAAQPGSEIELPEPLYLSMRTRVLDEKIGRETFAVVSPSYTPFDVDKIAAALSMAMPPDARCTIAYNGERAKFDVTFHSNVAPEDAVAGEFFKAGLTFRTDDTGSGSITGFGVVWQNLCLNLIIIDEAKSATVRIRHIGSVEKLAANFRRAMMSLQGRLDHFIKRWGFARTQDVVEQARHADPTIAKLDIDDIFPGLFRGLIEREVLKVKGDSESLIEALLKCHEKDDSSAKTKSPFSRAAVANAITRYAHEVNQDPFAEDDFQVAAGEILFSDKPLVYVAKS